MRVGAGVSTEIDAVAAAAEAAAEATADFLDAPDLVVVFAAHDHHDAFEDVAAFLRERFPDAVLLGCAAEGIVGGARELEAGPAVAIWAAALPETTLLPFYLRFSETDGEARYDGWPEDMPEDASLLFIADPFSVPTGHLLALVNAERPGLQIIGGMASGVRGPGEARLLVQDDVHADGAVAVAISGRVRVQTLVSQGCRPIGKPAVVTRADRNIIFELAGQRPIDRIRDIWNTAEPSERALMQAGLFIGRVVDEYKATEFDRGDFLIRTVVGADPEAGFVAVGDVVNIGETVQFHVRDPGSADEDLRDLIGGVSSAPAGALLFTCNGRGSNMFEEPDHDASIVSAGLGGAPLAGFFANGEVGPVGGKNFLHGHTASVALFVDTQA